jgi:hypothetical protein
MKLKHLEVQSWKQILGSVKAIMAIILFLGLLLALPANAQENVQYSGFTQSVIPDSAFKPWRKMHEDSYEGKNSSAVQQCQESIGEVAGLLNIHCSTLAVMLEKNECQVKRVEDGSKYRQMRGRVNGNKNLASKLTPNLEKQLGRVDRALRCDLGDGIIVDWFTGVTGQSCNNLGFLYTPPPVPAKKPSKPIIETIQGRTFHSSNRLQEQMIMVPGAVNIRGCCNFCLN